MFENFQEQMEMFACIITVDDNCNIAQQEIAMPRIMIEQEFMSLMQQAHQANHPVRVRLSRIAQCRDEYYDELIEQELYIEYSNLDYVNSV